MNLDRPQSIELDASETGEQTSGLPFLLRALEERWGDAFSEVYRELIIFYGITVVGFCLLYFIVKSTNRLQLVRKDIARVVNLQRNKKLDMEDFHGVYGGGLL